jgi:phage regulator Rha-like protein
MTDNFRIDVPFEARPPRLKDLVNKHTMGDVWVRDTPFGPITDSLKIAEKFGMHHHHVLRAVKKCRSELATQTKYGLCSNIIENNYLAGPKGRETKRLKYDITEFGLALLLLYINSPKARLISSEIIYRFFILKSYLTNLNENQIGAIRGHYSRVSRAMKPLQTPSQYDF